MVESPLSREDAATLPLASCVMVTANRPRLMRRAVQCFLRQTYPSRELVVLDDGDVDLAPVLAEVPARQLQYVRIPRKPENVLGALRNRTLELARGAYVVQWDDDDWYHPERLAIQIAALEEGYDACALAATLMHLNTPDFLRWPYVGHLKGGVPGTIAHRRDASIRYPAQRRAEDTIYLDDWRSRRHLELPDSQAHLFIRTFHGDNTWEQKHFLRRLRNSPRRLVRYAWHRWVRRDLFGHPRFQLSNDARDAFEMYLEDSFKLGLLDPEAS